ncbi:MAG: hypothetical protein QXK06_05005 [Candidatus Diapherotrites archaeon]
MAFFLLFFASSVFSFACSGVVDFGAQYSVASGLGLGSVSGIGSFVELKNGTIMEFSGNQVSKLTQTSPIILSLETSNTARGKIYYALATKEKYFEASDYESLSLFTWIDSQGISLIDGVQANIKPENCTQWNTPKDAILLDLSNYPANKNINLITPTAMPAGTFIAVLCAPADVSITITQADLSGKKYSLGKGIYNGGIKQMIALNEGTPASPESFARNAIEQIKAENACIEERKIKWNLSGLLEKIVAGKAKNPVEILLEPDKDGDNLPDETDPAPETPQAPTTKPYPGLASGSEYNIIFLPLKWNSSSGGFEEKAQKSANFFKEIAGLQDCKNISIRFLKESDVKECGFDSLNLQRLDPISSIDLVKNCVISKTGFQINSANSAIVALTNQSSIAIVDPRRGQEPIIANGFTETGGNTIIANLNSSYTIAHELGHVLFNFCDQYRLSEFQIQDAKSKQEGIPRKPGFTPGCQNKYPGPDNIRRYNVVFTKNSLEVPASFNPATCPSYPKCNSETGSFTTCCPNSSNPVADCTGRFIPINTASGTIRGTSVMGAYYAELGDLIQRQFDCFEKETIRKMTGCNPSVTASRVIPPDSGNLMEPKTS